MGFSAYILETLNRYGKVNLGPLGTFDLNYTPARWQISKQYFDPPYSTLSWTPALDQIQDHTIAPIASVLASMHDISYEKAEIYCKSYLDQLSNSIHNNSIVLNPIGTFSKNESNGTIEFIKNPNFDQSIKFDPLRLSKINQDVSASNSFQWWLVIASALFLGALYFAIYKYVDFRNNASSTTPISLETYPSKTSMMHTNIAPLIVDSNLVSQNKSDTALSKPSKVIIITGTFCHHENAEKMKSVITKQGFEIYEEDLKNGCVRLGVPLIVDEKFDDKLVFIRKNIESSAWILDQ